jgi:aspartate 1-decarboxylase
MFSTMLKAKIHGATVTSSHLDYEGSLTIDPDLMDYVKILPYEKILVSNLENGNRFETYAICGERGKGEICLNGATAHLGKVGDRIIIFTFALVPTEQAAQVRPRVIRVDARNKVEGGLRPV